MPIHTDEKERLLHELKAETLNQLSAIQAEDSEIFLQCTENCSSIMEALDGINEWSLEDRKVLEEILEVRNQISLLIPPLYEKIKLKKDGEKQINFVKRRYHQADQPVPSIFLDKKI